MSPSGEGVLWLVNELAAAHDALDAWEKASSHAR